MNKDELLKVAGEPVAEIFGGKVRMRVGYATLSGSEFLYTETQLLAMYAAGAEGMRERAAQECATEAEGWRRINSDGRSPYADYKLETCEECALIIRALPITPTNTEGEQGD